MKTYKQCLIQKDTLTQVAWLEDKNLSIGKFVELKSDNDALWEIKELYSHTLTEELLKEHQKLTRNIFKSIPLRS